MQFIAACLMAFLNFGYQNIIYSNAAEQIESTIYTWDTCRHNGSRIDTK